MGKHTKPAPPLDLNKLAAVVALATGGGVLILTLDEKRKEGRDMSGYLTTATGSGLSPTLAMAFAHHALDVAQTLIARERCDCESCATNAVKVGEALVALDIQTRPERGYDA